VRQDTIPEFDAAGDGPLRRTRSLLPTALVSTGQRHQHLSRPQAVAIAVELNMPFQVVSSRWNISGITSSRPKKK
jgi:hypothetical protein